MASEHKLIKSALNGNKSAFGKLVELYQDQILYLIYDYLGDYEVAKDAAQDVFIKAYKNLNQFNQKSAFKTWLYRIVVNLSYNAVKRRKTRREYDLSEENLLTATEDVKRRNELENNPHIQAEKEELRQWVTKAVDSLPLHHRTVVILHEFEGLTHAEIAAILNCSEGTVRSRLHYARRKLRELLKPYVDSM